MTIPKSAPTSVPHGDDLKCPSNQYPSPTPRIENDASSQPTLNATAKALLSPSLDGSVGIGIFGDDGQLYEFPVGLSIFSVRAR